MIRSLDPATDFQTIYRLTACYEFPFDVMLGLQLAFFKSFASTRTAPLLARTGQIAGNPVKRAIDTGLVHFEILYHGFDHPRSTRLIAMTNRVHHRWPIRTEDYIYVLGTQLLEPLRWLERYGWRPPCCHERAAMMQWNLRLAHEMGIDKSSLPTTLPEFQSFYTAYEQRHLRFTPDAQQLFAISAAALVATRLPPRLAPLARPLTVALIDEPLRRAVGASIPPALLRAAVHGAFRARALAERVLPPRKESKFVPGHAGIAAYPDGYTLDDLGPQPRPTQSGPAATDHQAEDT